MSSDCQWLEKLPRFSKINFNLYRTWLLLKQVVPDYAEMNLYFITGSKGKGTTAAALAAILTASGIDTGLITSPHLISICERIKVNNRDIPEQDLWACVRRVRQSLPPLPGKYGTWIFSEVLLAAGIFWLRQQGVNTLVLESGLGGRLDPGNVFRRPRATCITSVTAEHQGILGHTLPEIAREKAGILKPYTPVVTAAGGESLELIEERAHLFSAPVLAAGRDFAWRQKGARAELQLPGRHISFVPHGFETRASRANKAMAACLAGLYPGISSEAIVRGLQEPGLPGRFEVWGTSPAVVLDVAHTPESVANLIEAVAARFAGKDVVYVAGFLADKKIDEMLRQMLATGARVYCAPVRDARSFVPGPVPAGAEIFPGISAAVEAAAARTEVLCVTGSFAAVAEARLFLSKQSGFARMSWIAKGGDGGRNAVH